MTSTPASRREFLGAAAALAALPWLSACSTPLPLTQPVPPSQTDAERLLGASAEAHGLAAYQALNDINVRYEGEWRPLIDRIQPVVVDKTFRGGSEERILPAARIVAQAYTGSAGRKQVRWQRAAEASDAPGDVAVWFNGAATADPEVLSASALVAEAYGLFLLGPMWLTGRGFAVQRAGTERVDGRLCDVVNVWLRPSLGRSPQDRVAVCIDQASGLTRRVRFTLEGTANTAGAVAQVDTFEHERRFGVMWPMRSYEEVVHPIRLPAHDWRVAGLDVNRGYAADALAGPRFSGTAAAPAAAL